MRILTIRGRELRRRATVRRVLGLYGYRIASPENSRPLLRNSGLDQHTGIRIPRGQLLIISAYLSGPPKASPKRSVIRPVNILFRLAVFC
jgi:hypothetical protein